ncbi:LysR family transcriptional regulator [Hwanghaeella grinnelliae]|uniref:LysR family transcriptional regulator n=1 Tax=Hwanghaeella grinnelliae TaxID=2500179 RepID=A0A3S2Z6Q5_9PROT|nr:LysR family transcriptional regulator [Hwanghaeella grinnelliae]RVU35876.1 LysR family transcriptional regulator [Hwanghaeella grinnelliae]
MCVNAQMSDWDNYRYFLAVAREGTLSGAARALSVNHATVLRRLRSLEEQLQTSLFERRSDGYSLTSAGEEMLDHVARMEEESLALELLLAGQDVRLAGDVRVTTVDSLADAVLGPLLPFFTQEHPGITIELATDYQWANLSRREADIALRPSNNPGDAMVGRRVGLLKSGLYRSPDLPGFDAASPDRVMDWRQAPILAPDGRIAETAAARWFNKESQSSRVVLRGTSFLILRKACLAGMGVTCLPHYLGEGLVRIESAPESTFTDVWLLTHPELRKSARVRAVLDWMAREVPRRMPN